MLRPFHTRSALYVWPAHIKFLTGQTCVDFLSLQHGSSLNIKWTRTGSRWTPLPFFVCDIYVVVAFESCIGRLFHAAKVNNWEKQKRNMALYSEFESNV